MEKGGQQGWGGSWGRRIGSDLAWGGNSQSVHSKHGVTPGRMTLAWPLKPSVPPSTMGLMVSWFTWPSSSNSAGKSLASQGLCSESMQGDPGKQRAR